MNEQRINYCIKRLKNCKKETSRVWICVDVLRGAARRTRATLPIPWLKPAAIPNSRGVITELFWLSLDDCQQTLPEVTCLFPMINRGHKKPRRTSRNLHEKLNVHLTLSCHWLGQAIHSENACTYTLTYIETPRVADSHIQWLSCFSVHFHDARRLLCVWRDGGYLGQHASRSLGFSDLFLKPSSAAMMCS